MGVGSMPSAFRRHAPFHRMRTYASGIVQYAVYLSQPTHGILSQSVCHETRGDGWLGRHSAAGRGAAEASMLGITCIDCRSTKWGRAH